MKRASYDAAPIPSSLEHDDYRTGTRDYTPIQERFKDFIEVKDVVDLYKKNISWIVSDTGTGKLHRMIRNNFVESLKRNKINTTPAHTNIVSLPQRYSNKKLGLIREVLKQNKICFFSDTKLVLIKNCLEELFSLIFV